MRQWIYRFLVCVASLRSKRRLISGSVSRFWQNLACRFSSWGVGASMTLLTWTPGLMNISAEGGPERTINGP